MSQSSLVPIGDIARACGTSVSTVRYYDEIGLITATGRVGGKRRFDPDTVGRVNFIRRAQEAGFSLEEIQMILDDEAGGWLLLVEGKIVELARRRDELDLTIAMLIEIRDCGCSAVASCPRSDVFAEGATVGDSQVGRVVLALEIPHI